MLSVGSVSTKPPAWNTDPGGWISVGQDVPMLGWRHRATDGNHSRLFRRESEAIASARWPAAEDPFRLPTRSSLIMAAKPKS